MVKGKKIPLSSALIVEPFSHFMVGAFMTKIQ